MTDLSPQAQAVLDAFGNTSNGEYIEGVWIVNEHAMLAAALRAVVEHLGETHAGFDLADRYGRFVEADDILAIAAELEGTNG